MTNDVENAACPHLDAVDEHALEALFFSARTANTFAPIPVSDQQLADIWELARWAPTGANMQPLRVVFVRTDAGRARLTAHMYEGNKAKTASAPAVAILAIDTRFHEYMSALLPFKPEVAQLYASNEALRDASARLNAALQAGYFILAVRARGLAAGPMSGFDAASLDAEFFPDGRWRSLLVVNIGRPGKNAWLGRLPRLDHTECLRWE
ncbi:malonic semialdehyde reductase (plasmid) [Rhodococcus rhodochrous]|uniref:malonic semialdehyde reductase n=1 Tax=Rhodococcus rhodochrous TaxID=1829 RepID=UPI00132E8874|nr:malonic semialdehyde reductase [Rhodococcus rhodochrous]QHG85529.1 malonic semialdehyde reductase [Rhodococcus rhodochrous]